MKLHILISVLFFYIFTTSFSQNINKLNKIFYGGNFAEAAETAEKLISEHPGNAELHYKCGISFEMINRCKQAEKHLAKAYMLDSLNTVYLNAYANISEIMQNRKKAVSLYLKTLKIDSVNFNALNNLAKLNFINKNYKKASAYYLALAKQDSLNPYYYRKTGLCKLKQNKPGDALKYYIKAYLTDTTDNLNIQSAASAYLKTKKYDKAIEMCKKGIKNDSVFPGFYKITGDAHFAKNHYFRAVPFYKKTVSLGDSSYNTVKRLGISLCETKKYEDALPYNIAVFNADSSSYSNTLYLCRNYLGLKNYDKSLQYAEKTLKLLRFAKAISHDLYDDMAKAYSGKGEYKKAIEMYNKRLNVFDNTSKRFKLYNYYNIALNYDKLNDKKNALKYYEKTAKIIKNGPLFDKENPWYKYSNKRITEIKEDMFFEGE
ncbi:MAG: tetratricopeptide repeat protein [Chlorobi bacterium]|nr:tetratricopeptide repeat protein [Chlorobiota bacterium]